MATSRVVREEVAAFLQNLLRGGIALITNPVVDDGSRVGWPIGSDDPRFLRDRGLPSINDYRWWIEHSLYSAVLFDGALLQLTYEFADRTLVSHRLSYVPCPFDVDTDLLATDPLVDVFDVYAAGPSKTVVPRSMIRFDFDANAEQDDHPAAHLTINSVDCRVACAAPLRLGLFVDFIFRHFYPAEFASQVWLGKVPAGALAPHTVTEDQRGRIHINWPR